MVRRRRNGDSVDLLREQRHEDIGGWSGYPDRFRLAAVGLARHLQFRPARDEPGTQQYAGSGTARHVFEHGFQVMLHAVAVARGIGSSEGGGAGKKAFEPVRVDEEELQLLCT